MLTAVFFVWCAVIVTAHNEFQLFPSLPVGVVETGNILCREQSTLYVDHLKNLSLWAHQMRDATAKSITGLLTGSTSQFGQFQECLEAQAPFHTQYCLASVTANVPEPNPPRNPKSLTYDPNESVLRKLYMKQDASQQPLNTVLMGWCVPASCTPNELQNHLNNYLASIDFPLKRENVSYTAAITDNLCQKEGEYKHMDQADVSFGLLTIIIISLVTFSTSYDIFKSDSDENPKESSQLTTRLLLSFSIKKNLKKLPHATDSCPSLKILYGVRVFSICMIIMDHRFGTHLSTAVMNFNKVEEQYRSPIGTIFFRGDLFVDSFFILSGLLVTFCLLIQFEKTILNPLVIIFLRYIRLTPLYAFVIFYHATFFKYFGEGPMWKTIIDAEVKDCRDNWWTNILYVNNYVNVDQMCMVQSWYLPCDFHYFILAVFICITIKKNKKYGLTILGITTLLTILIPFIVTVVNKGDPVLFFYLEFLKFPKKHGEFMLSYTKSHTRASPYFIGMMIGYIYYRLRKSEKRLRKISTHLITCVSVILIVSTVITGTVFYDPEYEYSAIEAGLYSSLHRIMWSLGTAGLFYVASYGTAKFIYKILSWKPWVPISKLVYGAYLVHFQFQLRNTAKKGGPDLITYFDLISYSLSDIVLSFSTAFLLYLAVEAPFRNLFHILLIPQRENKPDKAKVLEENVSEKSCDSHL